MRISIQILKMSFLLMNVLYGHVVFSVFSWSTSINRLVQWTVKFRIKVHLWGCFSKQGFGTLYLFTYNLNVEKIMKIYEKA